MMRDLLHWDPFHEMEPILGTPEMLQFSPDVELKETGDAYLLKADMPGVKEDDVDIAVSGNRLTISGKREEEKREEKENYFCCERAYGAFTRSLTLPETANLDAAQADLKDGVLSIRVPKKAGAAAKKIAIGGAPQKGKAKA